MTSDTNTPVQSSAQSRPRWGRIIAWLGLISLLVLLFLGLQKAQKGQMRIGEKAPNFILTTFDGKTYQSADLRGKVVLVNIWASWCIPCKQEAPELETAWRAYQSRGDVLFLGVAWTDTDQKSAEYLQEYQITYPNGPDLGTRIYQAFRATGVPETYVIDKNGILSYVKISPFESVDEIKQVIDATLEKQ
jgi:cytochrome c biogenesis protein CcmG/thiol:disulfide interchange protein DsbE